MLILEQTKPLEEALATGQLKLTNITHTGKQATFTCKHVENGRELKVRIYDPAVVEGPETMQYTDTTAITSMKVVALTRVYGHRIFDVNRLVITNENGETQEVESNVTI